MTLKNFRAQPELRCCANCKHHFYTEEYHEMVCGGDHVGEITKTDVCDDFEVDSEG